MFPGMKSTVFALWRNQHGNLAVGVAKFAVAVGFLSVVALHMTGNRIENTEKDRIAALAGQAIDANSTGSLQRAANATRIDPCALPPR
jgi:hypothetical protein